MLTRRAQTTRRSRTPTPPPPTTPPLQTPPRFQPGALEQHQAEWRAGSYVRVYGALRPEAGARVITAFSVRPVHDFNEVRKAFRIKFEFGGAV